MRLATDIADLEALARKLQLRPNDHEARAILDGFKALTVSKAEAVAMLHNLEFRRRCVPQQSRPGWLC